MSKKYSKYKNPCNKCGGFISFDDYPNPKWPIHYYYIKWGNKIEGELK